MSNKFDPKALIEKLQAVDVMICIKILKLNL